MSLIKELGIYPFLPEILDLIKNNDKTCVQAPTGLGKSLGIPFALANSKKTVYISVPTRAAARALCDRQRDLLKDSNLNFHVGFAAEGEKDYNVNSKIVYGTTGHWVKRLLNIFSQKQSWPNLTFCDIFIIDEVHTGTMDNDVLIALFHHAEASARIPKLLLSSATFNPASYPAYIPLQIPVQGYPTEIRYIEKPFSMKEDLYDKSVQLVLEMIKNDPDNQLGHFLIFGAGAADIEYMVSKLQGELPEDVWVLPAYSAMKREDLDMIFQDYIGRKVVVATNIAETSLTIPDVGVVIDTLTEKRAAATRFGGTRLVLSKISKDSAEQRKGRTGRTRSGIVVRMCTELEFESYEDRRPDEISQVGIYNLVLSLLDVGLDPETLMKGKITSERIRSAVDLLTKLNLLDDDCKVTEMGHFAPQFPLSARLSAILYRWIQDGHDAYIAIVILSLLECYGPPPFYFPRQNRGESIGDYVDRLNDHKITYFQQYEANDEMESMLKMWCHLMDEVSLNCSWDAVRRHCFKNSLNNKKIREIIQSVRRCCSVLECTVVDFDVESVMKTMIPYMEIVFDDRKMYRTGRGYTDGLNMYKLDDRRNISDFDGGDQIIALMDAEFVGKNNNTFRVITIAVNITDSSSDFLCSEDSDYSSDDSD